MENNIKKMSGEESIKIITDMIEKTRCNIKQGSFHLLFWGWLVLICSLTEYLWGQFSNYDKPWIVWLLTVPGVFVSLIYGFNKGKRQTVYTYADRLYMWTWLSFLVSAIILVVLLWGKMQYMGTYILMLAGFPTFLSGVIIKFRALMIGGLCFWALSLVSHFTGPDISPLTVPVAMFTGYLIPGYILKKEEKNGNV
ncbi:MAG TPA: hypothetical protein DEQ09_04575 [Bacteroidales bacterium]|nr:hypothetical protein [Bacteroidales bacterium]